MKVELRGEAFPYPVVVEGETPEDLGASIVQALIDNDVHPNAARTGLPGQVVVEDGGCDPGMMPW